MEEKLYSVTLADGTVLNDLGENGTYYVSETEVDEALFADNCSPITISDGETTEVHPNMEFIHILKLNGKYLIGLRDITEAELEAERVAASLRYICNGISDDDAVNYVDLFPAWDGNKSYSVGDRVRCGKKLFKCLTAHTAQPTWSPTAAPSLWARTDDPTVEWPDWVQPTGSSDAYTTGAKVTHDGMHWVSEVDNNTWEPGVYGWTEQTE